jgi:hypothetical protein
MVETDHTEQHRPRGRWSGTCPLCPGKLAEGPKHTLVCLGCETTIAPPPRAPASWEVTGEQWEDYSAPGNLVAEWGRSTAREPWSPPRDKASAEAPHIREPHTRGRQDDLLDAAVGAYVAGTERLTDTLRTLVKRARTAPKAPQSPTKRKGAAEEIADLLFAHLDEATHAPADPLRQILTGLPPALHTGLFSGAIALAADILLRRGVDLWAALGLGTGPLEPLAFRLPRTERFAGSHHAVAVALSEPEIAPRPSPPAAPGKHPIPGGIQFGRIALNPSHTGSGRAPGENAVIDMLDAQRALGGLTRDDLALLADDKPDPNKRKQRARAWERATDALRERDLIPPRKRQPVRAAPLPKPKPVRDLPTAVEVAI